MLLSCRCYEVVMKNLSKILYYTWIDINIKLYAYMQLDKYFLYFHIS